MSDISFYCPHCEQHIEADEALRGQEVTCPECNQQFIAPSDAPSATAATKPPPIESQIVSFTCPSCQTTVRTPTLRTLMPFQVTRPASEIMDKVIDKMIFEHPAKPLEDVTCPHCEASYKCTEIKDLSGEVVFACPHCKFIALADSIKISDKLCCEHCKGGFTGGAARIKAGNPPMGKGDNRGVYTSGDAVSEVPIQCRQETLIKDSSGAQQKVQNRDLILTWDARVPANNNEFEEHIHCPICERTLRIKCASLEAKVRSQKLLSRWACGGPPLLAILVGYGFVRHPDNVPGWAAFLFILLIFWFGFALFQVRVLFAGDIANRIMLGDRVSISEEGVEAPTDLYSKTGLLGVLGREKWSMLTIRHIVDPDWHSANKWQLAPAPKKA